MNMKVLDARFVKEFVDMADDGYSNGYHERNGGNLSYRIKPEEMYEVVYEMKTDREWMDIGASVPGLAGDYFMVTGTGRFFHHVKEDPENNCGIIRIDDTGTKYQILWGFADGGRPTSELPTHLLNHQIKKEQTDGKHRVIYHCHPANLIALTFVLPLTDAAFTKELWPNMTECPVVFPDGIGVLPWMVCGSMDIGLATCEKMKQYDAVIWAHHGVFVSGESFDIAFGLCHTIEKSAEIAVKIRSMQPMRRQTMTRPMFEALAKAFNLKLAEKFLR
jgi:rhamnulose-1-phosphate aldolase